MMLAFYGDCNTAAVRAQIIQNFVNFGGHEDAEFHCGATTLVNRRKRSNARTITIRFNASKKTDVEKVKQNPDNELRILKDDVKTVVIPKVINDAQKKHSWSFLNKGVKSLSTIRADGAVKEVCGEEGAAESTVFNRLVKPILQKCGKYLVKYQRLNMLITWPLNE